jgi:DNA-binding NtrC family response regulator
MLRAINAAHAAPGTTDLAAPAEEAPGETPIIVSPATRQLYDLISRAARTTMTVLVFGETGSGKELVAHALHERSLRSKAPFRAVNCDRPTARRRGFADGPTLIEAGEPLTVGALVTACEELLAEATRT